MAPRSILTYEKIAKEIQKRPSLWDTLSFEYRDADRKKTDWEEMSELVYGRKDKLTVTLMKRKWKNMRDAYVRDYRTYLKQVKFGNAKAKTSSTFEIMSFINPHIKERSKKEMTYESGDEEDEGDFGETDHFGDEGATSNSDSKYYENNVSIEAEPDVVPEYHFMPDTPTAIEAVRPASTAVDNDETMSFFMSLAKTVQRLKPYNQAVIKKTVANLILDAEIREAKESKRDINHIALNDSNII